jgi:hypothetical protein
MHTAADEGPRSAGEGYPDADLPANASARWQFVEARRIF